MWKRPERNDLISPPKEITSLDPLHCIYFADLFRVKHIFSEILEDGVFWTVLR